MIPAVLTKKSFVMFLLVVLLLPLQVLAQSNISLVIKQNRSRLHYPRSVERFYKQEGFRLMWVLKDTINTPAWNAMQILDCVLQYGLDPSDYHPKELTYQFLHKILTGKASDNDKAYCDIMLTDAIITLVNHLHYGKFNPYFSLNRVDGNDISQFKGDKILLDALEVNDVMSAILNAEPRSEAYINMQRHMKLLTTKYSGSNYVKPEGDIRKLAINMERLRWINTTGKTISLTCIVKDGVIVNHNIYRVRNKESTRNGLEIVGH